MISRWFNAQMRRSGEAKWKQERAARALLSANHLRKMVVCVGDELLFAEAWGKEKKNRRRRKEEKLNFHPRKRFPKEREAIRERSEGLFMCFPLNDDASCITAIYERARVRVKGLKARDREEFSVSKEEPRSHNWSDFKAETFSFSFFILFFGFFVRFHWDNTSRRKWTTKHEKNS